jgi:hypothetical protein
MIVEWEVTVAIHVAAGWCDMSRVEDVVVDQSDL